MVFPKYNYKQYHIENKSLWPKSWQKMIKEHYLYCKQPMTIWRWLSLMFWIIKQRLWLSDLPSEHIYWKAKIEQEDLKSHIRILDNCILCKKDVKLIHKLFNNSTSIDDILKIEKELNEKIGKRLLPEFHYKLISIIEEIDKKNIERYYKQVAVNPNTPKRK